MHRSIFNDDHEAFRDLVRNFLAKNVVPHFAEWEAAGKPARDFFREAAALGLIGIQVPEVYGGDGVSSYKFNAILIEEAARADVGLGTLRVHMDLVLPYLLNYCTEEQKRRWLPGYCSGDIVTAIAMTEPGTGSDLAGIRTTAHRDGDHYVLNGAKTFITGGFNADRILVVARTSPAAPDDRRHGLSILVVDTSTPGFEVGRILQKVGLKAQDTCELSFTDVRVPVNDLLGEEGEAFSYLSHNLPQERLTISVAAWSSAARAVDLAREYTAHRDVFGRPVASFQNTKFVLAECAVDVAAGQAFLDQAIESHDRGELTAADAAGLKLWMTEMQGRVVDKCLQLHGGYGYMTEYPIARLYADARVTRIYGGTSEVMKSIVAKSMGL
ncbi:acyl-CoA dehydrogenase family protein [Gordonia sp. (in: high G+C Gram-positive bacteria)]|uniref:acyl-CoA dehydrogenase family protein n=1 Tax=Gordonia sp. (in: high G+C Gram-positive bacteria) TaxID=84139 RepID=UPI003529ADD1